MEGSVNITVGYYLPVGAVLLFFGLLGLKRGVDRELFSMLGIALAMWLASSFGPSLAPLVNRLYKLLRFALMGGLTSGGPAVSWQDAQAWPDLIRTAGDVQLLVVGVFGLIVLLFYVWGQGQVRPPQTGMSKLLGLVAGGINGFLVAYFLFPALLPQSKAVITLPGDQINAALSNRQTIALAIVVFTVLLIAFGLHKASRPGRSDRGDSNRRD
jgi:uncharacterized membrane protein required for colicin V production